MRSETETEKKDRHVNHEIFVPVVWLLPETEQCPVHIVLQFFVKSHHIPNMLCSSRFEFLLCCLPAIWRFTD